jgi:hypothetical protein
MSLRFLGAALAVSAVLLSSGCACHKHCCKPNTTVGASPCCPTPAPPCCPTGGPIPPVPVTGVSGYAPSVVSIPSH